METPEQSNPKPASEAQAWLRGLLGAAAGGVVGYFIFSWLVGQGFYALALPGVLLGVGAAWMGRSRCLPFALLCGFVGLGLGIFSEWAQFPFTQDHGLGYFLAHVFDLRPMSLILIAFGGAAAFWFAWRGKIRNA
jgi:hypothetical protein